MSNLPTLHRPALLAVGLGVIVLGWLLRRWSSRNDMTSIVTGAVTGSMWQAAKNRERPHMPGELQAKLDEFQAEPTHTAKAKKAVGYAVRHALAQAAGIAGWISLLAGVAMSAAGFLWK